MQQNFNHATLLYTLCNDMLSSAVALLKLANNKLDDCLERKDCACGIIRRNIQTLSTNLAFKSISANTFQYTLA